MGSAVLCMLNFYKFKSLIYYTAPLNNCKIKKIDKMQILSINYVFLCNYLTINKLRITMLKCNFKFF